MGKLKKKSIFSSLNLTIGESKSEWSRYKFQNWGLIRLTMLAFLQIPATISFSQSWLEFKSDSELSRNKRIVLIAGDEAYRSEETLPMLAKILSMHHGFHTTVLFSTDHETGFINPNELGNIQGLEKLREADLVVIATRFREYPDQQMAYFDEYIESGKPVIGIRTATHAFRYVKNPDSRFAKYDFASAHKGWEGGFGKKILGETWVSHHGENGKEGTRALISGLSDLQSHPILTGVGEVWGITDVYGIKSLPSDAEILLWGLPISGMGKESPGVWEKSVMPVAWTRSYTADSGKKGRVFTTTMGASIDFRNEGLRKLLVNACYWAMGIEGQISKESIVDIVGNYEPTMFGFDSFIKGKKPIDYK